MIPHAVRRGDYVFTSTLDSFEKLAPALARAGAAPEDVVQIAVSVDASVPDTLIVEQWRDLFRNAHVAPALRITPMALPLGQRVQVQATAVTGGRRLFVTATVNGRRPNGELPTDVHDEIDQALTNVADRVTLAGGSLDDLLQFWAFAKDGVVAVDFTEPWLKRFPQFGDRPARKTFLRAPLRGEERIQLQATALIGAGHRANFEVPGVRHRDPLPMGARLGDLFMSSGILSNGPDPSDITGIGPMGDTLAEQIAQTFENLEILMAEQGGSLKNVALLGALLNSYDYLPALRDAIDARFAPSDVPALQLWWMPMADPRQMVQLFASAVF